MNGNHLPRVCVYVRARVRMHLHTHAHMCTHVAYVNLCVLVCICGVCVFVDGDRPRALEMLDTEFYFSTLHPLSFFI